jgi:hypothetical protein
MAADAWRMSSRIQHPSSRRLLVAIVLVAPGGLFVAANVLQYGLGLRGAADWLDPLFALPIVEWIVTALVLAGPAVALLLAASRLLPIRLVRDDDAWEVRIRVRIDVWAIAVATISVLVGGVLAAHLIAENLACVIGLRSTC